MTPSSPARGIDASGTEVQLPVPSEDTVVTDANGLDRRVYAGQPVPRDLLDAYNEKVGGKSADSDQSGGDESGGGADELPTKRAELDAFATGLGIEEPDKLPNKDAVIDAIKAKQAETADGEGGGEPGEDA